jgi:hypothetical protein
MLGSNTLFLWSYIVGTIGKSNFVYASKLEFIFGVPTKLFEFIP